MLDVLRNKSRSIVIYLVLGVIILTFVISFGPASNKLSCGDSDTLARVDGESISTQDWQYAFHFTSWMMGEKKEYTVTVNRLAMDKLIERKILAKLAKDNGIRFVRQDAEDLILKNRVIILGTEYPLSYWGGWPTDPKTKKPADFNYAWFKNWVRRLQGFYDVNHFLDQQVEEMHAKAYKDTFLLSTASLETEKWIDYQNQSTGLIYKTAVFNPDNFKTGIVATEDEVAAFLKTPEGKKESEEELKRFKKKYTDIPLMRNTRTLLIKIQGLHEKVKNLKGKSLDELVTALPEFAEKLAALKDMKTKLTAQTMPKAVEDIGAEKAELKVHGWIEKDSSSLDKNLIENIFTAKVGTISGPVFVKDGAIFIHVEGEKGGKATDEVALKRAAKQLIINTKAKKVAQSTAARILDELKKGKPLTSIKDMPELLTEGPVNPLEGNLPVFDAATAGEIWNLNKKGAVLPRVLEVKQGKRTTWRIVMFEEKQLPSKEDFESMLKEQQGQFNPKSMKAYDLAIKYHCQKVVRNNKLEITKNLRGALTLRVQGKVKPEEAAKMPPEKYVPCQHVGFNR
ncbi:MAG: peptidylprolyl isomerase [Deltaproteobacteria bacterium]|nr:peptidylprolyl isomerase [Deltaproteobacteria bacterium]